MSLQRAFEKPWPDWPHDYGKEFSNSIERLRAALAKCDLPGVKQHFSGFSDRQMFDWPIELFSISGHRALDEGKVFIMQRERLERASLVERNHHENFDFYGKMLRERHFTMRVDLSSIAHASELMGVLASDEQEHKGYKMECKKANGFTDEQFNSLIERGQWDWLQKRGLKLSRRFQKVYDRHQQRYNPQRPPTDCKSKAIVAPGHKKNKLNNSRSKAREVKN